jgi:DNA-binding NarL/FixJ family response regulator
MKADKQIRVLLVEDTNIDAEVIKHAINGGKHLSSSVRILRTQRLQEAIQILDEGSMPINVILLDLSLPDAKGLKALVELNTRYPSLPIIVLSDLMDEQTIKDLMDNGARKFLNKSECSGHLIEQVIYQLVS